MKHVLDVLFLILHPWLFVQYLVELKSFPRVAIPRSINEKYFWRKIVDRNPAFVPLSDKIATKSYMNERFPSVKYAAVLWQGRDIRKAPPELLNKAGYLKANHGSGLNYKLGDRPVDINALHNLTQKWLAERYYGRHGEWGYKDVKPTLLIEEDVAEPAASNSLIDITIYAFGSDVSHIAVMLNHKTDFIQIARYDQNGKRLAVPKPGTPGKNPAIRSVENPAVSALPAEFTLPPGIDELTETARAICSGFDHLRVDFLWNGANYFLTEITIYSMAGYIVYSDMELRRRMADYWDLRQSWLLTTPQRGWRKYYAGWLGRQLHS